MNISIKNQIILPLCEKPKKIKASNSSLLIAILQASRILFSFTGLDFFWTLHSSIVHTLLLWGRSKRASVIRQLQPLHPLNLEDTLILVSQVSKCIKQIISPELSVNCCQLSRKIETERNSQHPSFHVYYAARHFVFVEGTQI